MQFETALPWLAFCFTKVSLARRVLDHFGSPDAVFGTWLKQLGACELPARSPNPNSPRLSRVTRCRPILQWQRPRNLRDIKIGPAEID